MKIISITPAHRWAAVYATPFGTGLGFTTAPLAVWAQVEEDGETRVVGLAGPDLEPVDGCDNFLGYNERGDKVDGYWAKQAARWRLDHPETVAVMVDADHRAWRADVGVGSATPRVVQRFSIKFDLSGYEIRIVDPLIGLCELVAK